MNKKETYLDLLSKSYDEAVKIFQKKYGQAKDDYFKEKSYERFLKGEIKAPGRANYSRFKEGLECHHIDENKFLNMAKPCYIKDQKIPFKYQKKDRLIYCDSVEHVILHALISKETNGQLGLPGYDSYLKGHIYDWYLFKQVIPKSRWVACYKRAYLKPEEALEIVNVADDIAYENTSSPLAIRLPKTLEELEKIKYEKEKEREESLKERQRLEKIEKAERDRRQKEHLKWKQKKDKLFYSKYPNFYGTDIGYTTNKQTIAAELYKRKYKNVYKGFIGYQSSIKNVNKNYLLDELYSITKV